MLNMKNSKGIDGHFFINLASICYENGGEANFEENVPFCNFVSTCISNGQTSSDSSTAFSLSC